MRCFILFVTSLASASTPEESRASTNCSGVVLLQRPSVYYSQIDLDELGRERKIPRLVDAEHPSPHFAGVLARLANLKPLLEENESLGVLVSGEWHRWTPHRPRTKPHGVHAFLSSVVFFDWCLFASAIMVFLILHMLVLGRMGENGYHLSVLVIWLCVGGVYNAVIWGRFGSNAGLSWFVGYLLEFIFLVENIFIFHIVIEAFKTPVRLTTKALHIVVWAQIMFEMVFFMGLAHWLRTFTALPYILGVWLICCGILAARGTPTFEAGNIMETAPCRAFTSCLGDRLSPSYQKDGECLLRDSSGKMRVSLLGLVVFFLLLADFLLEIDVVLTKIEELPNPYIAFTSSAVAAFSIPELFFVSKGLLKRFVALKYGIGFVLVLFGAQMLLSSVYVLKPIIGCMIIVGVLAACVIISTCINLCSDKEPTEGNASQALSEVGQTQSETGSNAQTIAEDTDAANLQDAQEADAAANQQETKEADGGQVEESSKSEAEKIEPANRETASIAT